MMTQEKFLRMIVTRMENDELQVLLDPDETRFQIGMLIGILKYHIPPNIQFQESCPVLPLQMRTHEIKDPIVREFVEKNSFIAQLLVVVFKI